MLRRAMSILKLERESRCWEEEYTCTIPLVHVEHCAGVAGCVPLYLSPAKTGAFRVYIYTVRLRAFCATPRSYQQQP